MDVSWALGVALGHVRAATAALVAAEDPSGESLFLAGECLDLEGVFSEFGVVAEVVDAEVSASVSLDRAADVLASIRAGVPLVLWSGLQALRARAS